jgi:DUF4097 and DUF4098 domain-containing protein YvlB
MKNGLFLALALTAILPARAQLVIEKHINVAADGFVSMNFQISDSIRIVTWKKNEVYVKSSIDVNDNKDNDEYKMSFEERAGVVEIRGKLELEKGRGCWGSDSGRRSNNNGDCCCNCRSRIIHDVYIPENTDFSVETINGNIVISGNTGRVKAHSISGYIDLSFAPERPAQLLMRTITGTMYSNFDFPAESGKPKHVGGGSVSAELNGGGGKRIDLETISGDIFFRKEG